MQTTKQLAQTTRQVRLLSSVFRPHPTSNCRVNGSLQKCGRGFHQSTANRNARIATGEQPSQASRWVIAATMIATTIVLANLRHSLAEAPPSNDTQQVASSTLPLSAGYRPRYDLSETNINAALDEFKEILGQENVNVQLGDRSGHSSTEWSPAPNPETNIPSVIVYPRNTDDVSSIAKICHRRRIPMIGFSGGTSLEGTLAAQNSEVCVDFGRHMNKIVEFRKRDMDVTVEPGVGYEELNQFLASDQAFFPPDPGPGAQIGGMVAQGCSGTNAYRYGTMKEWVLGLEVVLPDGTIIHTRHRPRKSSSGYDMTRLFVGSEGTLGFVTKIHLKLTRAPQNVRVAVIQFDSVHQAVEMASRVLQSGHQFECMELLDAFTMRAVNEAGYCSREWSERPSLFIKFSGGDAERVKSDATVARTLAEQAGSTSFDLAKDEAECDELWAARKTAMWSTLALKQNPDDKFLSADSCVPISRIADIITKSQQKLDESQLVGGFLGHVGDGNVHTTVLYSKAQAEKAHTLISDIQQMAIDMDGTVSGEHGLGLEFRDKLPLELGDASVDAMRKIKAALDPLYLMNPGKMIRLSETN